MFSKFKVSNIPNSSLNLAENNVLRSRPHTTMFVVSLANSKSYMLSWDPSSDHMMPCAEVCIRAQTSRGKNITVLSHLKVSTLFEKNFNLPI